MKIIKIIKFPVQLAMVRLHSVLMDRIHTVLRHSVPLPIVTDHLMWPLDMEEVYMDFQLMARPLMELLDAEAQYPFLPIWVKGRLAHRDPNC